MRPYAPQKFDPIGFTLGLLMFVGLIVQGFITKFVSVHSTPYHLAQIVYIFLVGLYLLYSGMKKLRQRREQQERAQWYTQPSILFALGAFFLLPSLLLELFVSKAALDALPLPIEMAVFAPSGVCILAASYFFFRGLKRKETT
jgi:putative Mn2+ efflux pump MntP